MPLKLHTYQIDSTYFESVNIKAQFETVEGVSG